MQTLTEVNIGAVPITLYKDPNGDYLQNGTNGERLFVCDTNLTYRDCYRNMILAAPGNYVGQNVKGVRFQFAVGGGFGSKVWDSNGNVETRWSENLGLFLQDLKTWGIQRISVTPALWGFETYPGYQEQDKVACDNGPVYFYKWLPFGLNSNGDPDCLDFGNGYSTAARGSQFQGWDKYFNMWTEVFKRIKTSGLEVTNIDMSNELDIIRIPVQARLILDCIDQNQADSCTDVLGLVRKAAALQGVDSWSVTFSTPAQQPTFTNATISLATNPNIQYCDSAYGDSALLATQSAFNSALEGGRFGPLPEQQPNPGEQLNDVRDRNRWLHCNAGFYSGMATLPKVYDKPKVLDVHIYPCVANRSVSANCTTSVSATTVAEKYYTGFWRMLDRIGRTTATAVIGETHSNQNCDGYADTMAGQSVVGLKNSLLYSKHRANLVVRPWNNPSEQVNPPCYAAPFIIVPPYQFP